MRRAVGGGGVHDEYKISPVFLLLFNPNFGRKTVVRSSVMRVTTPKNYPRE